MKDNKVNLNIFFVILWILTVISFLAGIFMPAFIMNITVGSFFLDSVANSLLGGGFGINKISIVHSVYKLVGAGGVSNIVLGVIIASFSIIFPGIKYYLIMKSFIGRFEPMWVKRLLNISKWSMLDVFVIGILVVGFKDFPGGSRIMPGIGVYFFAISVILSLLSHKLLQKIIQDEKK